MLGVHLLGSAEKRAASGVLLTAGGRGGDPGAAASSSILGEERHLKAQRTLFEQVRPLMSDGGGEGLLLRAASACASACQVLLTAGGQAGHTGDDP
jgi:hypothetical protein